MSLTKGTLYLRVRWSNPLLKAIYEINENTPPAAVSVGYDNIMKQVIK